MLVCLFPTDALAAQANANFELLQVNCIIPTPVGANYRSLRLWSAAPLLLAALGGTLYFVCSRCNAPSVLSRLFGRNIEKQRLQDAVINLTIGLVMFACATDLAILMPAVPASFGACACR